MIKLMFILAFIFSCKPSVDSEPPTEKEWVLKLNCKDCLPDNIKVIKKLYSTNMVVVRGDIGEIKPSFIQVAEENIQFFPSGFETQSPHPEASGLSQIGVDILHRDGIFGNPSITVAVVDTGVEINHPALIHSKFINTGEIPGNGKDDDQNGLVDDVSGFSFFDNTNDVSDDQGHGTHVSGIISGLTGNLEVGVATGVKILPIKFMGNGGGSLAAAIDSINYAVDMQADVINASWGARGSSELLDEAVQNAIRSGVVFVAAAGNERSDNDQTEFIPSNINGVISVAAVDAFNRLASFSNFGRVSVAVAAPGVNIFSTFKGSFSKLSGTSMASPAVAGLVSLMLSVNPDLEVADIKNKLIENANNANLPVKSGGVVDAVKTIDSVK